MKVWSVAPSVCTILEPRAGNPTTTSTRSCSTNDIMRVPYTVPCASGPAWALVISRALLRSLEDINDIAINGKKKTERGVFRESNSGPLAPEARIIPLDQTPSCLMAGISYLNPKFRVKLAALCRIAVNALLSHKSGITTC
jgi:hypothetical protein